MAGVLIQLILAAVLAATPPLSADQQTQLESARDSLNVTDEGALYPLLENALTWPEHVEAGAAVPDYAAIAQSPAAYRGQLFLIEGTLRRSQPIGRLALPGPWEGKLSEWAIQWGREPANMVIVNLTDAPALVRDGAKVRLAARFYKVWQTTNKQGEPLSMLVFVGRDARVLSSPGLGFGQGLPTGTMVLILLAGAMALWWVFKKTPRMSMEPKPTEMQRRRREARQLAEEAGVSPRSLQPDDADDEPATLMPKDPAEALKKLQSSTDASIETVDRSFNHPAPPDRE